MAKFVVQNQKRIWKFFVVVIGICSLLYLKINFELEKGEFHPDGIALLAPNENDGFYPFTRPTPPANPTYFNLHVNTEGCKIPITDIMPKYIAKNWRVLYMPNCSYEKILAKLDDDSQLLTLLPEFANDSCCVQEIQRLANNDNSYKLSSTCQNISDSSLSLENQEMFMIKCGQRLNFEANLVISDPVKEKLSHWKNTPTQNYPFSVLFFGIDSTSRSHAYRSLPKSLAYMTDQMGFHDFKGYHSVAAGTIQNFMGFLVGRPLPEVRETCATSWAEPFDPCPFVWKNYSQHNYVTFYAEDGYQTFNWGGQQGFKIKPTDYYIHPLFTVMDKIRLKTIKMREERDNLDQYGGCASSETAPQFLLRYTKRFTQKYLKVPTFSFTWFACPFHDYQESLGSFDDDILNFMKFLNSSLDILESTLIVFNSDHGLRSAGNIERFVERGLPPLFIRMPGKLKRQYSSFAEALKVNTERLTSPYDILHTFLHLLQLGGVQNKSTSGFNPVLEDRSSLFLPVPTNRTCNTIHVYTSNCVCNVTSGGETFKNPFMMILMKSFLERELNAVVSDSKYKDDCVKWKMENKGWLRWLLSSQVLFKDSNFTDILVHFKVGPGAAEFEAKVRVYLPNQSKSQFGKMELVGKFSRRSLYGIQSSCVKFQTDKDKEMKELCYCKSEFEKTEQNTKRPG